MKTLFVLILFVSLLGCSPSENLSIVKVNKATYTGLANDPLAQACRDWALSLKEVETIFSLSKKVDKPTLHHQYYHLPCEISGEAVLNGKPFNFTVNAGSYITINTNNTFQHKGCNSKECKPFFLINPESDKQ